MKLTKRIASILFVLIMVFAMTTTAMAYTIETSNENHTYEVYQIFTGDLSEGTLSNVVWGKNGTGETGEKVDATILEALEDTRGSDDGELDDANGLDAQQLAVIEKYVALSSEPYGTVTSEEALDDVPSGYYLIKDVDGSLEDDNDSYTQYIVKIVGNVEISPKADVPTVIKKVDDTNDSYDLEDERVWEDTADHDIGDSVRFQITATLPSNYDAYETYSLTFVDTLSKGLTYDEAKANLTVYADDTDITGSFDIDVAPDGEGTKLTVSCDDLKQIDGITKDTKIILEYSAVLNEEAVVGSDGNPNTVKLQFSNDPNWDGDPDGDPTTPPDEPKGETPEDTVIVFTYQTIINKVDGNSNALTGAMFMLEKKLANGEWEEVEPLVVGEDGTTFTFTGLDDGIYRLTETETPDGYNSIDPIEFEVTAEHTEEQAQFVLKTLEAGGADVDDGKISFDVDLTDGSLTTNIVNNTGSILPETGGIGTTIFYIVGGALVVLAIVLLITNKRMRDAQ